MRFYTPLKLLIIYFLWPRVRNSVESTATTKTGVDLNIKSDKKSNKKLEYEKVGEYVTYTAKDNYAFKLVKDHKTEIWKPIDSTNYSDRVEVEFLYNEGKAVTVFLPGNKTKVFKKDVKNDPWKEIDTTKVTPISINIDYPHQSYFYKNELEGKLKTFSAKKGFTFNCANEYVDDKKVEIWKSNNESEYSNKIEVDLMNNDSKAVTIYFPGNTTKLFMKYNKNDPWTEINISKVNPKSININYPHQSYFYKNEIKGHYRTFTIKPGFIFNGANEYVDGNEVEIWKTLQRSEYSNKIEVQLKSTYAKAITVFLGDCKTRIFTRIDTNQPWNEIDTTKLNLKFVNIDYPHESYFYKNKLDNNVRTFTAKKGFGFKCAIEYINDNIVAVWRAYNDTHYANKIVNEGDKKVTIHLADGSTKVIEKGSDGNWPGYTSFVAQTGHSRPAQGSGTSSGPRARSAPVYGGTATRARISIPLPEEEDDQSQSPDKQASSTQGTSRPAQQSGRSSGPRPRSAPAHVVTATRTPISIPLEEDDDKPKTQPSPAQLTSPPAASTQPEDSLSKQASPAKGSGSSTQSEDISSKPPKEGSGGRSGDAISTTPATESGSSTTILESGDSTKAEQDGSTNAESGEGTQPDDVGSGKSGDVTPTTPAPQTGSSTQQQVKLLKANASDAANPLELGSNEYTSNTSGDVTSYQIANGVNCVQLIFGQVLLWVYDSTQHGGIYPKSVDHDTNSNVLVLKFAGLDLTFENTTDGWIFTESGPLAVKFHVVDPSDPNNTVELATNQFTVTTSGDVTTFTIGNGVNCNKLLYSFVLLWVYDSTQHGGKYPKSLDYTKSTDTLVLKFDGVDITFAKNDQGTWEYTETQTSGSGAVTTPADQTSTSSTAQ